MAIDRKTEMDNVLLRESLSTRTSICRLCLSTSGESEPIRYNEGDQYILQKVYECTTIQITPLAGVPSGLCTICRSRLEDSYQFRWQCIRNDEIIHRIAAGLGNKPFPDNGSRLLADLANAVELQKRLQATAPPDYSSTLPRLAGIPKHLEAKPQLQEIHTQGMSAEGYSYTGCSKQHPQPNPAPVLEVPMNIRRKRGRPPKQQYDFGTHLSARRQTPSGEYSESMERPSDGGWNDGQGPPGEVPRTAHEPSGNSSENQDGQEWFKIKLEQMDHQGYPPRNDQLQLMPTIEHSNREHAAVHLQQLDSAAPDQASPAFEPTRVKRSRGRPPREGGCPNEGREEYRFRCQYCSARFKAAINLKLHTNTHTGEKPYLCTICSKSFAHPSNLSVHMKLHSNHQQPRSSAPFVGTLKENDTKVGAGLPQAEKKFQCPYCQALFALSFQLKIHINTHTGQKPYVCKNCGKGFAQPSNLHVHGKKHCRRKQLQFVGTSPGEQRCNNGYPQTQEHTARVHTTEPHNSSLAYGAISPPFHQHGAAVAGHPSAQSLHQPMNIDESQRNSHSSMSASHAMLV